MDHYIVLRSITHATRLQRAFAGYKSTVSLVHTPHKIPSGGCSYSIRTSSSNLKIVKQKADELGVRIMSAYKKLNNGEFEEVRM